MFLITHCLGEMSRSIDRADQTRGVGELPRARLKAVQSRIPGPVAGPGAAGDLFGVQAVTLSSERFTA